VPSTAPFAVTTLSCSSLTSRLTSFAMPKSRKHDAAVVAHHDVVRLDVAVHEALAVSDAERLADLADDAEDLAAVHGLGEGADALAAHELHHEVGAALLGVAHVVDLRDAGVVERGGGAGFALEAGARHLVPGALGREHLHRDGAAELLVPGRVDDAHAALADLLGEDVAIGDPLAAEAVAHVGS